MYEEDFDSNVRRLVAAHPLLFRGKVPRVSSQLSEGWYGLVDKLCGDIEAVLGLEDCSKFTCHQIKEKLGTLRFYWSFQGSEDLAVDVIDTHHGISKIVLPVGHSIQHDRIRSLVDAATLASEYLCEACGRSGQLICRSGWLVTRCDRHALPDSPED